MSLFSVKMRAAEASRHISGAERIVEEKDISAVIAKLTERAMTHSLGQPDFVNIKVERIKASEVLRLPALKTSSRRKSSPEEALAEMENLLKEMGVDDTAPIMARLKAARPMRGAILYDIATGEEIEPDPSRGIRVTYMDATETVIEEGKNHFREALVLATKVVNAPGMVAELCISDDPDYVTGYFASKATGYVRLSPLKAKGDANGGRVFVCDTRLAAKETTIDFLEKKPVLVENVPLTPDMEKMSTSKKDIVRELDWLKTANLYRSIKTLTTAQEKTVSLEIEAEEGGGEKTVQSKLLFASNNYLNLATEPRVKKAAAEAALTWGAGSGGSRLTTGSFVIHRELEAALARFKEREAALLFNTGYAANVGIISALADPETLIFSDAANHASIIDGCRLARAKVIVYRHGDMDDLGEKLATHPCRKGLIVSDAVFSMDGDIVDLPRFVALGRKYRLLTMIDEAHATGVIGRTGHGTEEYFTDLGYDKEAVRPDIIMGTLSKALGAEGGFAAAEKNIIDYLRNKARSFIFSTSQSPATLAAAQKALEIIETEPERVARLQRNVEDFCDFLAAENLPIHSATPIIPIIVGDEGQAMQVAAALDRAGLMIPAIRYPTVAKGKARLRVALMAEHTKDELERAAHAIGQAMRAKSS